MRLNGVEVQIELGETAETAYRGDRGKVAYDHSGIKDADPHGSVTPQRVADLTLNSVQATPADDDFFPVIVNLGQRKTTWSIIKGTLKTYFDTLYSPIPPAWTAFTPTLTAATGTITASSATGKYVKIGSVYHCNIQTTITTVGSAAGSLNVAGFPSPNTAVPLPVGVGRSTINGKLVSAMIIADATLQVAYYDNTTVITAGNIVRLSITYEAG